MSFDIFVQRFRDGDRCDADPIKLRATLAPHLVERLNGWNLRAKGATAEIHGIDNLSSGFMVTHVDGVELHDVIVRVAAACDLVILAPGVPAALTHSDQRQHLPDEIRNDAVLVTTGPELVALIESA